MPDCFLTVAERFDPRSNERPLVGLRSKTSLYTFFSAALEFRHFEDDFEAAARRVPTGPQDFSPGCSPVSANLSRSRQSVLALHLFKGAQTETVRLHFDASASSASLKLALMNAVAIWACDCP